MIKRLRDPRHRKALWVTLSAAVAVLAVVGVVLTIALNGRGGSGGSKGPVAGGSPGDTVKGYLEALARGDAESALAFASDQPASREFLSNAILKQQIAKSPITDIRILDGGDSAILRTLAKVHVAAKFGDQVSDTQMMLNRVDDRWLLANAAVKVVDAGDMLAGFKTLTIFGKSIGDGPIYLFPGGLEVGTTSPYLNVNVVSSPSLKQISGLVMTKYDTGFDVQLTINDAAKNAIMDELTARYADCDATQPTSPPPCPSLRTPDLVEPGSVKWGKVDLSDIKITDELGRDSAYNLRAIFSGDVAFPVSFTTRSGQAKQDKASAYTRGTADLAESPPKLSFER